MLLHGIETKYALRATGLVVLERGVRGQGRLTGHPSSSFPTISNSPRLGVGNSGNIAKDAVQTKRKPNTLKCQATSHLELVLEHES